MIQKKSFLEQLFYAVSIFTVVIGGIIWIANINWVSDAHTKEISDLDKQMADNSSKFEEIRIRLAHIEDAVKYRFSSDHARLNKGK